MLTLKKPFTKSSPETPAAAEASVKGKQLLHGRTKARVESLTAELNAARQALTQAEQAVGEQLVEGLDATASTDAMKQAADQVRILESALVVATQKDEAAHTALKEAQSQRGGTGQNSEPEGGPNVGRSRTPHCGPIEPSHEYGARHPRYEWHP